MTTEHLELMRHKRSELNRCMALLADAIARADRWYARREATLAGLDRDAAHTVGRLRADGAIRSSIVWHRAGTV